MSTSDNRIPVEPMPKKNEQPWANFQPLLTAELGAGNRCAPTFGGGFKLIDPHFLNYAVELAEPLHLRHLRANFRLPENIELWAGLPRSKKDKGYLTICDPAHQVYITSPLPPDWTEGEGKIPWDPEPEAPEA